VTSPCPKKAPPPGEEDASGNNLSFPVIWSDGVTKALRGTYLEEKFQGVFFEKGGERWFVQADPGNEWQAESYNPVAQGGGMHIVSAVDWGDNLEARAWKYGGVVRVETVLYQFLDDPMTGYTMMIEDESISGRAEVWGTNGHRYNSPEATVYSGTARLMIQKLTKVREEAVMTWDGEKWVGDVKTPLYSWGVWDDVIGPDGYAAEVNVQGKIIYGFNWFTRKLGDGPGDYRISFVLDRNAPVHLNTDFGPHTIILPFGEEEEAAPMGDDDGGSDLQGGIPGISHEHDVTYIDVRLLPRSGGGGGGGSGGGGNGK
jgi:hypothetical protein